MDILMIPDAKEIMTERQSLVQRVTALVVNEQTYMEAADLRGAIKGLEKKIHETFDGPCDAGFKAWKSITSARKMHLDPLEEAEMIVNRKLGDYDQEQERKREAERKRLEEEARRQEEEARLAAAAQLEAEGQTEAAEALIEEPIEVAPVFVPPAVPKVEGLSYRVNWKCEVVDLKALVLAVAKGQAPIQALKADEVFLGNQVRHLQAVFSVPGVRKWSEKIPVGR